MDKRLFPFKKEEDILPKWQGTPIHDLLAYHNLCRSRRVYDRAEMVILMCMDYRKILRIPDNFAYVLRTGGGNPRNVQFEISYAIAVGGANALAVIVHDDCGMVGLSERRDIYVKGLIEAGWEKEQAEDCFHKQTRSHEIGDLLNFAVGESRKMQSIYPRTIVAPLYFSLKEEALYQVGS